MPVFSPFNYRAWVKRLDWTTGALVAQGAVHDGDSTWLLMDRGFYDFVGANCRLYGVNAYELNDRDAGRRALAQSGKEWLRGQIEGKQVFVASKGLEKYGRPLIVIWLQEADFGDNAKSVNQALLASGFAVPYMGELVW